MAKLLTLPPGAIVPDSLLDLARKEEVHTAAIEAIGGVDHLTLGYYNRSMRSYERHDYRGFMEVTHLMGNITEKDGELFLHAHGTFGRRDMRVIGGHLIRARVFPTLEIVMTPMHNSARRRLDRGTRLYLIGQHQ